MAESWTDKIKKTAAGIVLGASAAAGNSENVAPAKPPLAPIVVIEPELTPEQAINIETAKLHSWLDQPNADKLQCFKRYIDEMADSRLKEILAPDEKTYEAQGRYSEAQYRAFVSVVTKFPRTMQKEVYQQLTAMCEQLKDKAELAKRFSHWKMDEGDKAMVAEEARFLKDGTLPNGSKLTEMPYFKIHYLDLDDRPLKNAPQDDGTYVQQSLTKELTNIANIINPSLAAPPAHGSGR